MDRYEATALDRTRRKGTIERRGSGAATSPVGVLLFGVPFVGAGLALVGVGEGWIEVDPRTVHAPMWVLTVIGVVFALGGGLVWAMAWRALAGRRRQEWARRAHPGEPAFEDRAWDPRGTGAPRWMRAAKALGGTLFLTLFLSVFNWVAFVNDGPWIAKIVTGLFDAIALLAWWEAGRRVLLVLRFRDAWLGYARFPFTPGEPVVLRWRAPEALEMVESGTLRLCCVEEYSEVRRGPRNERTQSWVQDELWSGTWHLEQPRPLGYGEDLELVFEPPADAPGTDLHAERAVFWELVVHLERPGLDFEESYLVPVYPASGAPPERVMPEERRAEPAARAPAR